MNLGLRKINKNKIKRYEIKNCSHRPTKLIKKDINLTYFSPLNSLKDNSLKTENKITLLLTLNNESKICFPNQNVNVISRIDGWKRNKNLEVHVIQ